MATRSRSTEREENRRLSIRTLVIASAAAFLAAVITSQFAPSGTPLAAALTPVVVTLISEMLHRPTELVAQRITRDKPPAGAARAEVLPEGAGAGPPRARREDDLPDRVPEEPGTERRARRGEAGPVRVYGERRPKGRRRIAIGVVAATAVLAFAVAAAAMTVPELIAGESIGKGDRGTSFFGGKARKKKDDDQQQQPTTPTSTTQETETEQETTTDEDEQQKQEDQQKRLQQTTPQQQPTTTAPPQPPSQQPVP